jgi:hypothetical protein
MPRKKRAVAGAAHCGTVHALLPVMGILAVLVVLLVATIVVMPKWRYSATWGNYPTGVCGGAALAIVVLVAFGRL